MAYILLLEQSMEMYMLLMDILPKQYFLYTFRDLHKHIALKWNNTGTIQCHYFSMQIHFSIHCSTFFQPDLGRSHSSYGVCKLQHINCCMVSQNSHFLPATSLPSRPVLNFCQSITHAYKPYQFKKSFTPIRSMVVSMCNTLFNIFSLTDLVLTQCHYVLLII